MSASCRNAWSSTQLPIGTMRPMVSAMGTNSSGAIAPRVGWFQRSNDSNPAMSRLDRSRIGWYSRWSSSLASACRSSFASVRRRWAWVLAARSKTAILAFPSRLAWYMASSASRISEVGESASLLTVTPMLAVTWNSCSPICNGVAQHRHRLLGQRAGVVEGVDARAQEDELVAADPTDDVVVAQCGLEPTRHCAGAPGRRPHGRPGR